MVNKLRMTKEQAQRFCDPIIEFLRSNPEISKKIREEIAEIKRKNNNTKGFEKK